MKQKVSKYNKLSDVDLLLLLKDGDRYAFTEIYNRYSGLLYVYAFKLTSSGDISKDMVQELFISLWDKRTSTNFKSSLSAYLYTAIRYKFLKEIARQKVKEGYAEQFLNHMVEGTDSTEVYLEEKELFRTVERLVSFLPPKMARAFVMHKLEFSSYEEIAEELNISVKTVQNLISQATTLLRPKLGFSMLSFLFLC
ncbi:RNA polymerase sigma-70 factor [Mucilaginibacter aquaedulcis]|uniref:RNA polymerase sigma-70 factor n=1 Tax=Mucilaginibacter aquaedulcis TaxID=1187081 RepID=UPI0025B30053|nr:RNA polymerase sigma-70 factor [Mucilaginibacter aquaedulcis]MDN3548847.1 RNA polymerase sigma-70 factor [Mucilaginibacter aquaedulcis]